MNIATYAGRNLFRRRGRTILTMVGVGVTVLIFALLRTAVIEWHAGAEEAANDRLATRHKVSFTMQLPLRYIEDLRAVPGVKAATWANWFGAKDPRERIPFFAGFAVDDTWFDVVDEMKVSPDVLAKWKSTPNGVIIGDKLASAFEVTVGSTLHVDSDIYPGDWAFEVVGIYQPLKRTVDRSTLLLHWKTLNEDERAVFSKNQIGWMMTRITDANQSAEISRRIDAKFDDKDDQTLTMSEHAFQQAFLGAFAAVLGAFDLVSLVILLIMMLILANTIAMSVRERTHEYGVLRAIGFPPKHIVGFILGESLLVALVGGAFGLLLVVLLINNVLGPFVEENMTGIFPFFHAPVVVLALALVASAVLGVLAGILPAMRASRLKVTDALRRVD
jgi:putative ABC transport system permease protein